MQINSGLMDQEQKLIKIMRLSTEFLQKKKIKNI